MNVKPRLLLVDDEKPILESLAPFLRRAGFDVEVASDGEVALSRLIEEPYDLVIMDVLMPRLDGRETLRQMRMSGKDVPVILLTRVDTPAERAMALEEGADDYLNKPFDPQELVARIRAVLRRASRGSGSLSSARQLISGDLTLDRTSRRCWLGKQEVVLTPKATALLEYMMTHPDELLSRERLLDAVWGWDYPIGARAVDTRIAELRRALHDDIGNPSFIETIPGQGYRFKAGVRGEP